eukprot:532995-Prymnesium_polylepis.1
MSTRRTAAYWIIPHAVRAPARRCSIRIAVQPHLEGCPYPRVGLGILDGEIVRARAVLRHVRRRQ